MLVDSIRLTRAESRRLRSLCTLTGDYFWSDGMHTSVPDHPLAERVEVSDDTLTVDCLMVGRCWCAGVFPDYKMPRQMTCQMAADRRGVGIRWDAIDEDISVRVC